MKRIMQYLPLLFLGFVALAVSACGEKEERTVSVLSVWGGDELASFQAAVEPWETRTGLAMAFSGTRDLTAVLTTRIQANNPPDIAILPNPGLMMELARNGKLLPLNSVLDMNDVLQEYPQTWVDLGTDDGKLYAIFYKAANKSTIWYNPRTFAANGWQTPSTWDELITLSDSIKASGLAPWSMGMEGGPTSGWPGTDWVGEILLHEFGPLVYDRWIRHEISWTDARVRSAFEKFGRIALTDGYVPGGVQAILATGFVRGSYLPFESPPLAAMYYLGSFTESFIAGRFPQLTAGEDYSFFPFPTINPDYAGAVTGAADAIVMFRDTPTSRSLMRYLASAEPQQIWGKRGGFTSVNVRVAPSSYSGALTAKAAEQLLRAGVFRFDADDSMPAPVQSAFWKGILDYLQRPGDLDSILAQIEAVAALAYR